MAIVNRTPDSFYEKGRAETLERAVEQARDAILAGADIVDVGAVKAGPGEQVAEDEEVARLIPLVELLAGLHVPLSVETARPAVARAAFHAGASIVNDVSGLADKELAGACAEAGGALVLMHNGGQVRGRPRHPRYEDVVAAVVDAWTEMARSARAAGVAGDSIVVDPGLDFGKTTWHSLELMRSTEELCAVPWPVLVAPSRKDVVGETLGLPPEERLEGTMALVALAVSRGASIVRVHDVRAAVRVVRMTEAVSGTRPPAAPVRGLWD